MPIYSAMNAALNGRVCAAQDTYHGVCITDPIKPLIPKILIMGYAYLTL